MGPKEKITLEKFIFGLGWCNGWLVRASDRPGPPPSPEVTTMFAIKIIEVRTWEKEGEGMGEKWEPLVCWLPEQTKIYVRSSSYESNLRIFQLEMLRDYDGIGTYGKGHSYISLMIFSKKLGVAECCRFHCVCDWWLLVSKAIGVLL